MLQALFVPHQIHYDCQPKDDNTSDMKHKGKSLGHAFLKYCMSALSAITIYLFFSSTITNKTRRILGGTTLKKQFKFSKVYMYASLLNDALFQVSLHSIEVDA